MRTLRYLPCKADPDLWYKSMVRPEDNFKYYAYMLLYVDDCLAIHHDAEMALTELDNYFAMRKGSIGDPDIYLGAKLRAVELNNGVKAWSMSPAKYVKEAVENVKEYLDKHFMAGNWRSRQQHRGHRATMRSWMPPQSFPRTWPCTISRKLGFSIGPWNLGGSIS